MERHGTRGGTGGPDTGAHGGTYPGHTGYESVAHAAYASGAHDGINGSISLDPLFCDPGNRDVPCDRFLSAPCGTQFAKEISVQPRASVAWTYLCNT